MYFKKFVIFVFLLLSFFVLEVNAQKVQSEQIPTLTYSELMKDKELYLEKTVRVKSNLIYGFEWSFLCDTECSKRKVETWVDFIDEDDLCKGSKRKLKKVNDKFDNKADIVFVGKLSSGGFGHFGVYPYQFKVSCVEKFKKLQVEIK